MVRVERFELSRLAATNFEFAVSAVPPYPRLIPNRQTESISTNNYKNQLF